MQGVNVAARRPSLAIGVAVGLLAGSMLTALVTGGEEATTAKTSTAAVAEGGDTTDGTVAPGAGDPAASTDTAPVAGDPAAPAASPGAAPSGQARPAAGTAPRTATGGATPATAEACAGTATPGVRGVTDTSIKIGVGLPDLRALEPILGEQGTLGDQQRHFQAHLAAMRKKGQLPICGRDIAPVFRSYNILDPTQSRAVCQGFINDDKVFAVLTQFAFGEPDCVTVEHKTFLLDHGLSLTLNNFAKAGGRLFGLHPPLEVSYEIWAKWAVKKHLPGKKVGIYYNNNNADSDARVNKYIIGPLKAAGINPVVVTTNQPPAAAASGQDPNNAVAVQRFKTEGVQVVFNVGTGFQEDAKRQDFRPLYLRYGTNAKDPTSGSYDPVYMDGTMGVHWDQVNDAAAGNPVSARAEECIKEAEAAGIPRPHREWAEWNGSNLSCDLLGLLSIGLKAAGKNLTTDRLVLGMRTVKNYSAALTANITFNATKQWGIDQQRDARYFKECKCWKNIGPWEPLSY